MADEGVWSGVGGTWVCGAAAVWQLSLGPRTDPTKVPNALYLRVIGTKLELNATVSMPNFQVRHHHHHFICPTMQQYAHLREHNSRRAGQQGPI